MNRERRSREDYGRDREEEISRRKDYGEDGGYGKWKKNDEDDFRRKRSSSHVNNWRSRYVDSRKSNRRNVEGGRGVPGNKNMQRPHEGGGWHRGRHVRRQFPADRLYEDGDFFGQDELYGSSDWVRGRGRRGGRRGDFGRWMHRPFFLSRQEPGGFHRSPASDDQGVKMAIGLPSNMEFAHEYSKGTAAIQSERMIRLLRSAYIPKEILQTDSWNYLAGLVPEDCQLRGGSEHCNIKKSTCNRQLLQVQLNEQIDAYDVEKYSASSFAKRQIPRPVKRDPISLQDCDNFIHVLGKELQKSDGEMLENDNFVMGLSFGNFSAHERLRNLFCDLCSRSKQYGDIENDNDNLKLEEAVMESPNLVQECGASSATFKSTVTTTVAASKMNIDNIIPTDDQEDEVVVDFDVLHGDDSSENELPMDE